MLAKKKKSGGIQTRDDWLQLTIQKEKVDLEEALVLFSQKHKRRYVCLQNQTRRWNGETIVWMINREVHVCQSD